MPNEIQSNKIKILIADDHPIVRQALRNILEREEDIEVIAEASDGKEAITLAEELNPDVTILDIKMPLVDGLEATRQIKTKCPKVAILILTFYDDNQHILAILEAGASGYLTKNVWGEEVVTAVRGVATGETILSSSILHRVIEYALRHKITPLKAISENTLSSREVDVLKLTGKGKSNKEIAAMLNVSISTVKGYFMDIFEKLHVLTRTEAVIAALKNDIISLEDIR